MLIWINFKKIYTNTKNHITNLSSVKHTVIKSRCRKKRSVFSYTLAVFELLAVYSALGMGWELKTS